MVDGSCSSWRRLIRTTSCSSKTADRRPQIALDPFIRSFHLILPFDLRHHKRNTISFAGVRTHDPPHPRSNSKIQNSKKHDELDRSTTAADHTATFVWSGLCLCSCCISNFFGVSSNCKILEWKMMSTNEQKLMLNNRTKLGQAVMQWSIGIILFFG